MKSTLFRAAAAGVFRIDVLSLGFARGFFLLDCALFREYGDDDLGDPDPQRHALDLQR
jgi:hypothetical protein